MIEVLLTSPGTIFGDLLSAISSRGLEAGAVPSSSPAGPPTGPAGPEAVPARLSAPQGRWWDSTTSAIYGLSSAVSFATAALTSSLANRLRERLSSDGSIEYAETWKRKVTPSGLPYWAHIAQARRIPVKDCIGWRSPGAGNWRGTCSDSLDARMSSGHAQNLQDLVLLAVLPWPKSPMAGDTEGGIMEIRPGTTGKYKLRDYAMVSAYQSPRANDCLKRGALTPDIRHGLPGQAALIPWQTVTVNDSKNAAGPSQWRRRTGDRIRSLALNCEVLQVFLGADPASSSAPTEAFGGYRLNPYFSAWLMGFPRAWTECGLRAYRKQKASRSPAKRKAAPCS